MEAFSKKNMIMTLAAILVFGFGIMAYSLSTSSNRKNTSAFDNEIAKIKIQSDSDEINDIEKDLDNTNFSDSDKELREIEAELNNLK